MIGDRRALTTTRLAVAAARPVICARARADGEF